MAVRTIAFVVTPSGISPTSPQQAGVAGEDNATQIVFNVDDSLVNAGYKYRVDYIDGLGQPDSTDFLTLTNKTITTSLIRKWTIAGGNAVVRLVISQLAEDNTTLMEIYSFSGRLSFDGVSTDDDMLNTGLSELIANTKTTADNANSQANAASSATTLAGSATNSANTAAANANNARDSANTAAANANTAAAAANSAATSANNAADLANAATEQANLEAAAYQAATHENTVVELTDARHDNVNNTDFDNIGKRLDSQSSLINQKSNTSDVNAQLAVVASGSPLPITNLATLNSTYPTGSTRNYAALDTGIWYGWNGSAWTPGGTYQSTGIGDGTVTPIKTTFSNLLNMLLSNDIAIGNLVTGEYANLSTGAFTTNASFKRSGYIQIYSSKVYINVHNCHSIVFYTNTYTFISSSSASGVNSIPASAYYCVINKSVGDASTSTLAYCNSDGTTTQTLLENAENYASGYTDDAVNLLNIPDITVKVMDSSSIALGTLTTNSYANVSTGAIQTQAGINRTDYIAITAIVGYINIVNAHTNAGAFYDSNKVFISGITPGGVKAIPATAKYIIINMTTGQTPTLTYCDASGTAISTILDKAKAYTNSAISGTVSSFWAGKKANFKGDSITYGAYTPAGHETVDGVVTNKYCDLVGQKIGLSTVRNYAVSGISISGTSTTNGSLAIVNTYSAMDNDADLVVIAGGTNDYGTNVVLGTIADTTDVSFYGALNVLCKGLLEKYVVNSKKVVFISPIHRAAEGANTAGYTLAQYKQAISEVCAKYGIPVIDGFSFGLTCADATIQSTFINDGLHPNEAGHVLFANYLAPKLNAI